MTVLKRIRIFKKETKTKKDIFFAIISAAGVKKSIYYDDLVSRNGNLLLENLLKEVDAW